MCDCALLLSLMIFNLVVWKLFRVGWWCTYSWIQVWIGPMLCISTFLSSLYCLLSLKKKIETNDHAETFFRNFFLIFIWENHVDNVHHVLQLSRQKQCTHFFPFFPSFCPFLNSIMRFLVITLLQPMQNGVSSGLDLWPLLQSVISTRLSLSGETAKHPCLICLSST